MDGIRPQKKRQQAKRSAPVSGAAQAFPSSASGLPSAPGAELDAELVRQTLTGGNTSAPSFLQSRPEQQQQQQHRRGNESNNYNAGNNSDKNTSAADNSRIALQPFDVYVVLDFEATCEEGKRVADPEVIEFPMVLVDARTAQPVAEFQRYVRPVKRPVLSAFCTELTGITQSMVEERSTFPAVYKEALSFLASAGLGDAPPLRSYCLVTCGDWDLKVMLPAQMSISGQLGIPRSFRRWCNLKKCMGQLNLGGNGGTPSGMPEMLRMLGLPLQGRHHSGIDDCRNIAAVLCALLKRGCVIDATYEHVPMSSSFPHSNSGIATPQQQHQPQDAAPHRWHAAPAPHDPQRSSTGAPLPAWSTVKSSLADGSSFVLQPSSTVTPDGPPRTQARREKPAALKASVPRRLLVIDATRDAVEEILRAADSTGGVTATSRFTAEEQKTNSKFLSTLLRHKADQWKVPISANGYVLVADALRQPQIAKKQLTPVDVAVMVRDSDKQRFRLAFGAEDGQLYIAAAQGHSLEGVEPELRVLTSVAEVPVAVHGTYWPAWKLILACGYMSTMTRQHIHFAKGLMHDGDVISGMRKDVQIFIYLDVAAVLRDNIPLYESSNGVILTPGVGDTRQLPLSYVAKVVDRKTSRKIYPLDA